MKNKILIISALAISGCAQVVASNEKSITIHAPPIAQADAFEKAQLHCEQFSKDAVPSGTAFSNKTVFRCE